MKQPIYRLHGGNSDFDIGSSAPRVIPISLPTSKSYNMTSVKSELNSLHISAVQWSSGPVANVPGGYLMKWLYFAGSLGGGLAPPFYVYLRLSVNPNYAGPVVDPYLFIRGVAISAPTMPLFIALGLLIAAFIQVAFRYFRRRSALHEGKDSQADSAYLANSSWVTRRGRRGRTQ